MPIENIFKVRDEHNRILKLINDFIIISENGDLTVVKCKLCDSHVIVGGSMLSLRMLIIQHIVQHIHKNPNLLCYSTFEQRLKNNEFELDENCDYSAK